MMGQSFACKTKVRKLWDVTNKTSSEKVSVTHGIFQTSQISLLFHDFPMEVDYSCMFFCYIKTIYIAVMHF